MRHKKAIHNSIDLIKLIDKITSMATALENLEQIRDDIGAVRGFL